MVDWLYYSLLAVSFGSASVCLIAGMFGRKPSLLTMGSAVLTEVALVVQLIATIVLLFMGAQKMRRIGRNTGNNSMLLPAVRLPG